MKRPKAPTECPKYQKMLKDTETTIDENGVKSYGSGVTLEKLIASQSELCRDYGNAMLKFHGEG